MSDNRSPEDNANYILHKHISSKFFKNPDEYLRVKLFTPHANFVFAKNLFPYILPPNFKHICLWVNPKFSKFWKESRIHSTICHYLSKHNLDLVEMFENKIEVRSVLTIPHWHIICKIKLPR
jgi:hypothetical protein